MGGNQVSVFVCANQEVSPCQFRESIIFLPRLKRDCTGAMVVNFVRMSFSSLSFALFQMSNRNLDKSNRTLMFHKDIKLHLQSK